MTAQAQLGLEAQVAAIGTQLGDSLRLILDALPASASGPAALARELSLDKVLTSRLLKAVRAQDPMSVAASMPGPEPLRRFLRAAGNQQVAAPLLDRAQAAVDAFEALIRDRMGDRSQLDAVLSAWIPEARREFELRRKQAAFRAMSQLKGVQARVLMSAVVLHPSASGDHIDVVWVSGALGLHRIRPGVIAKFTTRRLSPGQAARRPTTLDGREMTSPDHFPLREFCSSPMPALDVRQSGEVMHYLLGGSDFGLPSAVDVIFAEVNKGELPRFVPAGSNRVSYFFTEVTPPSELMQFDVLVHEDLYPGQDPTLRIYDASFEGVASPNDPARDVDRLDLLETIDPLGTGLSRVRSSDVPRYAELTRHVFTAMGWDATKFRGYRCRATYPVYGAQMTMCFRAVER